MEEEGFLDMPGKHNDSVGKYSANVSGFKVASINYGLAPEHPFSDGLNDVVSTIRWIANNCKGLGIDCHRMALGVLLQEQGDNSGYQVFHESNVPKDARLQESFSLSYFC